METVHPIRRRAPPYLSCSLLAVACGLTVWPHFAWFPIDMGMLPVMGIALAGLIVAGLRCWPAIPIGIAAGLWARDPHPALWQAAAAVLPVTLGTVAAALLIRHEGLAVRPQMPARDIAKLVAICAVGALLNHLLRVLLLAAAGHLDASLPALFTALLRSGLGLLLWLPLATAWLAVPAYWPGWKTAAHFVAMMAAVTAGAALINLNPGNDPIAWGIMPALVWAALAFQSRGATAAMMVVAFFTLYGASLGLGPFHGGIALHPWMAEIYLVVLSSTTLLLARLADTSKTQAVLRETARQLRAREAQLNLFISDAPAAIAIFDRDMRYLAYSHRFLTDYDLPPDQPLTGRLHYDVFPEISEGWRHWHERALAGEEVSAEEDSFARADGRLDFVRWTLKPWRDDKGRVAGIILFSELITKQVEARRAAEQARARYRSVFDQTQVGIARSSLDRRFFEANEPACAIAGRTREEMLTLGPADITHPEDWPATAAAAAEMLAGKRTAFDCDERVVTRDGAVRWIHLNLSLVRDGDGRPLEFVSIVQDISERVQARARLNLARDQLMRVSRLSAMGAMASTLAHELNQPLASASNFLAAARHKLAGDGDRDAVGGILARAGEQVLRAGEIIRKMRQYTVTGELSLHPEDLDAMIGASCDLVRERKNVADVGILHHKNPNLPPVLADRVQLEQVITNLVLNGAEACSGRPVREVHIHAAHEDGRITVTVRDTGSGITPEVMENLFEPFRTTKEKGTGLGLPICRTIVEAHGGNLWAEPAAAQGAVLKFTLAVADGGAG